MRQSRCGWSPGRWPSSGMRATRPASRSTAITSSSPSSNSSTVAVRSAKTAPAAGLATCGAKSTGGSGIAPSRSIAASVAPRTTTPAIAAAERRTARRRA